ncbi:hypothetical protein RHGRI_003535 [Rhododendron griersonianum]|uniref:Uncharacterized protein n=1 Tax=Rhododendron griersonianum TaxID=479676 RepID=A0AAV6L6N2_9ERIC|nr:hypothetical protein RHGRI_003535 [Rhododendron griersonianum]
MQVSISSEDKKVVESKGIGRKLLTNFTKHTPLNLPSKELKQKKTQDALRVLDIILSSKQLTGASYPPLFVFCNFSMPHHAFLTD